ncbi:hypothetical protein PAL_GLEAN10002283 [Pteropus alecto]|uniref:Uncharacterized protein n=1 Tax=Pteropus alecto TaxID=9402 RepID=L5KQM9_PTEAL|nr:hypothetical protein PAL_GLEAN10002283 [Pteropus alecto]
MAVCSGFSFHPENPSVSPSPQQSYRLRPPQHRPEGCGLLVYLPHRLRSAARGQEVPPASCEALTDALTRRKCRTSKAGQSLQNRK